MTASRAPDVEALFDVAVVAFELVGDGDPAALLAEEALAVASAAERRRSHFAAGRQCARAGLDHLGVAPTPLLASSDRAPLWPTGVVGSITHTATYALAVVTSETRVGVGVDAERIGRVKADLYRRLFTVSELEVLASLAPPARDELATAIFGAKESFYKAQHPTTRSWVGFQDVRARLVGDRWEFVPATDLAALSRWRWPIPFRWLTRDGLAVAALAVRPAQ